jgi:hypothetical protein
MKTAVLITGLLVLLVANFVMMYYAPYGLSAMEGFQGDAAPGMKKEEEKQMMNGGAVAAPAMPPAMPPAVPSAMPPTAEMPAAEAPMPAPEKMEGFASYFLENAGGSKDSYQAMGAYDGVKLSTGNNVSGWRYTAPNEPLMGAEFQPGPDSLFIFKNNQCKPECCGASFSCGGGCVCTSPQQRQYIAGRGGNRSAPEDSA